MKLTDKFNRRCTAATRSKGPASQNQAMKTNHPATIIFFGSTTDSVLVLEKLMTIKSCTVAAVVTQPPKPIGRDHTVTATPVELWAKQHEIPVLTFESSPEKPWLYANEQQVIDTLQPIKADLLVSASYGIKIPWDTIRDAKLGGINVHPSILPYWRGADPVPWAIMEGDRQIGVSVVTLSETFDQGLILAQEKIPITPKDTSDQLRTKLFTMGADILADILPSFILGKLKATPPILHRGGTPPKYARKFTREDGFEPWELITEAMTTGANAERIERKYRALHPWPGVWTKINPVQNNTQTIRLKILVLHLNNNILGIDEVQLEGKKPVSWKQFAAAYMPEKD